MEGLNTYLCCLILLSLTPQGLGAGGTCSSSCQFVPGPPGRNGRDGIPGNPGAPGTFSYSDYLRLKEELVTELRQQLLQVLRGDQSASTLIPTATTTPLTELSPTRYASLTPMPSPQPPGGLEPCSLGLSEDNPASSCGDILQCNPEATSQDYWIQTTNGSRLMYCHMEEDKCGVRGVMRVVNINMTDPEETCPSPLRLYTPNGKRLCGSNSTGSRGPTCSSVTFPTFNYQYSHVCGRAVGFSYGRPNAFLTSCGLSQVCISGLSITHGAPRSRTHIWTYTAGNQEAAPGTWNCPCAKFPGTSPHSYIGENYYCESPTHFPPSREWYTNNTLWDNQGCYPGSNCCSNPRAPWFVRDLGAPTSDDLEIRWCSYVTADSDNVATEQVEIYVY